MILLNTIFFHTLIYNCVYFYSIFTIKINKIHKYIKPFYKKFLNYNNTKLLEFYNDNLDCVTFNRQHTYKLIIFTDRNENIINDNIENLDENIENKNIINDNLENLDENIEKLDENIENVKNNEDDEIYNKVLFTTNTLMLNYQLSNVRFFSLELLYNNLYYTICLKNDTFNYYIVNNCLNKDFFKYYLK